MKLRLSGHDYKYAVEQIMLALFPEERPEYVSPGAESACDADMLLYAEALQPISGESEGLPAQPSGLAGLSAVSRLSYGGVYAQAITTIQRGNDISRGYARVKRARLTGKLVADRQLQRIVKQSFFKAAACFLDSPPVWGSLTGIRPAQLAAAALKTGKSEKSAAKFLVREYRVSPERAGLCVDAARSALNMKRSLEPMDIALYVGIPFCPSRCAYCSFVSNDVEKSFGLIDPFVQTLLREIDAAAALVSELGLRVIAVYFGGGTPTALPAEALGAIMQALGNSIDLTRQREYTVEAGRPDTITEEKLEVMSKSGAKRACVNPQSMSRDVLKAIGRRHTPEDVLEAVRLVRLKGMSLNMDVIAGLPGDTPQGFRRTLDTVVSLNPENITVHTLSLKKGSRIMLEGAEKPGGADVADMLGYASGRLRENNLLPYYLYRQKFTSGGFENIGWCLPGFEGAYNICMMEELCTVLALGGGAVTKLVSPGGRIERIFNAKYPKEYILQSDKLDCKIDRIKTFYHTHCL